MTIEIRVPTLGESVTEATIGRWLKAPGDAVAADEPLVELETDKVTLEVPSPITGTLAEVLAGEGETVGPDALLGKVTAGSSPAASDAGVVGKADSVAVQPAEMPKAAPAPIAVRAPSSGDDAVREERVRMTKLRQTIARRLKEAQSTAAMLTTFNEVDMSAVMALRTKYKDVFEKKHGVKLGLMGFFTKAVTHALKEIPAVNAEIDGTDIIYKNFAHVGVAVGTEKGLVVPVVRDADQMSIAEIEKEIGRLGIAARDGKLSVADMQGGTFTISNGGVYGSLMSTPILNAPQSGILGMHKIQDRPVVVGGQIVIRPMMYLALSYDHRIVDGKEAVTFLVRVKDVLEDPKRLVLGL
ncbi:2-oxoglutarate dehydrogenase complex dihydrolipoyllysine-residue succinyltransferase [Mesorhizobium sp. B2-3-5]|uniref:2-oxoglutarate dehydrogenase complex dihydrolipoyllysine-residue succinyltransferase n=1 Tax=Mesorhizobium sp. B2-3-5 TaxID=2589958 RepID=UPI00112D2038|nr:2-oxoglutarate dehydrogenase complex dihydrolipoyllysine-residue succinyltransferase [Mesorhizobium sp. B2-3-5]TPM24589.1 2-oxoglutarate dehydrogenase complex dihydrolipoyllysine-residue succinyltransferase [Mesorhizobium sp. B2-3-5]